MKRLKKTNALHNLERKVSSMIEKRRNFYQSLSINCLVEFYLVELEKSVTVQRKTLYEKYKLNYINFGVLSFIIHLTGAALRFFKKMRSIFPSKLRLIQNLFILKLHFTSSN